MSFIVTDGNIRVVLEVFIAIFRTYVAGVRIYFPAVAITRVSRLPGFEIESRTAFVIKRPVILFVTNPKN